MSVDLIDLRAKVSPLGHCALIAHSRAHGQDVSEVVREVIDDWAKRQARGATILVACMKAKGVTAADAGIAGNSLAWDEP